jgi:phosphatidylinositol alpha-1,6-mannosyltransferase
VNNKPIIFLTLRLFSATGGIEKVCRLVAKTLFDRSLEVKNSVQFLSLYDHSNDAKQNPYAPEHLFSGHHQNLFSFVWKSIRSVRKPSVIILSHVNLIPVGVLLKCWSPGSKLVLFAHGIELWNNPGVINRFLLRFVNFFWSVSQFTQTSIQEKYNIPDYKCMVLNNALDPFIQKQEFKPDRNKIIAKLDIQNHQKVLFMLARIQTSEQYKGYDQVIMAMDAIKDLYPDLIYCIGGKYDNTEKQRIQSLVKKLGLENRVRLLGYVEDATVSDWYHASDAYVMPSSQEGFGLVFIEAMYHGLPVIAGNRDGSVDALLQGELGQLVDPFNIQEIAGAIIRVLSNPKDCYLNHRKLMENFGYPKYREKMELCLQKILSTNASAHE